MAQKASSLFWDIQQRKMMTNISDYARNNKLILILKIKFTIIELGHSCVSPYPGFSNLLVAKNNIRTYLSPIDSIVPAPTSTTM